MFFKFDLVSQLTVNYINAFGTFCTYIIQLRCILVLILDCT